MHVADDIVVATDSEEVVAAVRDAGGEAVLTSASHPSGTDRVAEVARRDEFASHDVIVNVQGDEPFAEASAVRGALELVRGGRFGLATAAALAGEEVLDLPQVVKVVTADDGRALYFSRAPIPWLRDVDDRAHRARCLRHHIGVYAYTRAALLDWVALPPHPLELSERLEQLRPLAAGRVMGVALVGTAPERGVDTEEDLALANRRWDELYGRPV
jgi:3-deoxy-manno-octulosonate cytidylyltransferase (CMP-KDO synthetase)